MSASCLRTLGCMSLRFMGVQVPHAIVNLIFACLQWKGHCSHGPYAGAWDQCMGVSEPGRKKDKALACRCRNSFSILLQGQLHQCWSYRAQQKAALSLWAVHLSRCLYPLPRTFWVNMQHREHIPARLWKGSGDIWTHTQSAEVKHGKKRNAMAAFWTSTFLTLQHRRLSIYQKPWWRPCHLALPVIWSLNKTTNSFFFKVESNWSSYRNPTALGEWLWSLFRQNKQEKYYFIIKVLSMCFESTHHELITRWAE